MKLMKAAVNEEIKMGLKCFLTYDVKDRVKSKKHPDPLVKYFTKHLEGHFVVLKLIEG
jgi:hypothetical protein